MRTDRTITNTTPTATEMRRKNLDFMLQDCYKNGQFELLQILYNKLNLFDNRRLTKQLGSHTIYAEAITEYIYADMVGIFIEEIFDNNNDELRIVVEEYFENKFGSELEKDVKCLSKIWHAEVDFDSWETKRFYSLVMKNAVQVPFVIYYTLTYYYPEGEEEIVDAWDNFSSFCSEERSVVPQVEYINEYFEIDNILKTTQYLKLRATFKNRMREFLTLTSRDFERDFLTLTTFMDDPKKADLFEDIRKLQTFKFKESLVLSIFDKANISAFTLIDKDITDYKKTVDKAIDDICLIEIENVVRYSKSQIGKASLDTLDLISDLFNPESLLIQLIYCFYLELTCDMIKKLLKMQYSTFSFRNVTGKGDAEFIQRDLDKLQAEYERLQMNYHKLEEFCKNQERAEEKETAKLIRPYQEKITALERKNEKLLHENEELKTYQKSQADYIELMQKLYSEASETEDAALDMDKLANMNPLFIGGLPDVVRSIRSNFSNSKHIQDVKAGKIDVTGIDCIIMFWEFMNHALYYKVMNVSRTKGIPVIYVRGTNHDNILHTISNNYN